MNTLITHALPLAFPWAVLVSLVVLGVGCIAHPSKRPTPAGGYEDSTVFKATTTAPVADIVKRPIAKAYEGYFTIGAALEPAQLTTAKQLLDTQFNRLTCENAMKMQFTQPSEGVYTFEEADKIATYARATGKTMTGHALLWHRATPEWVFAGLTPGTPEAKKVIKERLQNHIETVVGRYADVVDNWDVVNEAISDNASKIFRDENEGSQWHKYFGDSDGAGYEYVYYAFKYAQEALEKIEPGSSKGKLYYNDYNVNLKIDRILTVAKWLRDEKGIDLAGIGLQGHWNMAWPAISEIERTIDAIVRAGFDVKVSEIEITIYRDYTATGALQPEAPKEFTPQFEAAQGERYGDLFELFRKKSHVIKSVTFWGIADDHTWLDHEPVSGRKNHPLLFDTERKPKKAVDYIMNF